MIEARSTELEVKKEGWNSGMLECWNRIQRSDIMVERYFHI